MNRLLSAMKLDLTVQLRNNLYTIGIAAGLITALALAWLVEPDQLFSYVPALLMIVVGGSTLLYVAAMILFEKDEGTLQAVRISPLRPAEYLWSKIITLSGLALLEAVVMVGGAMAIMAFTDTLTLPHIPLLVAGILAISVLYTLVGIIMVVRYEKITDYLMPMAGLAVIFQLPFLYFLGWVTSPLLLAIPTSAPTMLMVGAYRPLTAGEWLYGVGYTVALLAGLTIWAHRAFDRHIIRKVG